MFVYIYVCMYNIDMYNKIDRLIRIQILFSIRKKEIHTQGEIKTSVKV